MTKKNNWGACALNHEIIVDLAKTNKLLDISKELNINVSTLRGYCNTNGIKFKGGHEPPEGFIETLVKLYEGGVSVKIIADELGCSDTTVKTYLNKLYPTIGIQDHLKEVVVQMVMSGIDIDYISNKFSLRRKDVSTFLKENDIDFYETINMDHNDKRFYVYLHKDSDGNVVYVGSGSGKRYKTKNSRTEAHKQIFDEINFDIVEYGLTKQESLAIEQEMIIKYSSEKLLNGVSKVSKIKEMDFDLFNKHLFYDETSPSFLSWKEGRTGIRKSRVKYGEFAGHLNRRGYYVVNVCGSSFQAHRIVYLLNAGSIVPDMIIDHIDGDKLNNNINNLRLVTPHENNKNRLIGKRNTSGVTGVSWNSSNNCWVATWTVNGKTFTANFNPSTKYPDDNYETAKQKAFELAVFTRKLAEEMHYGKDAL